MTRIPFLAAALVVALLSSCGGESASDPAVDPRQSPLSWAPCEGAANADAGLECATLVVPKDYDAPSRGTFSLAIARARATGPESQRVGTLFFNPGGPGVSGVDLASTIAQLLPPELRARFDLVSWDPRGVGRSSGLDDCVEGAYSLPSAGPVDWIEVTDEIRASVAAANRACAARYPDVVPYIGTNATVRDLDRLREAVGDERLTYWGTSYGTRIGFLYAHRYPDRVRALLLTSPVDPNATWQSFILGAASAPDDALGFFFTRYPGTKRQFDRVLEALSARPYTLPSGSQVTQWPVRAFLAVASKSEGAFPGMAAYVATLDTALFGSVEARSAARLELDRMDWTPGASVNGGAIAFIDCLDFPQRPTRDEQIRLGDTIRARAPIFGFSPGTGLFFCEGIDVPPQPVPVDFLDTRTPVLVIASTNDALTQYGWAGEVARNFRESRIVSYVGTSHTPYLTAGSVCVDRYGTDYLLDLRRPATDVVCPSAILPP